MSNFMKVSAENAPRVELHDKLGLTGAEISINTISAGQNVPFIHSHKQNEEIYYVIDGSGKAVIDNELYYDSLLLWRNMTEHRWYKACISF